MGFVKNFLKRIIWKLTIVDSGNPYIAVVKAEYIGDYKLLVSFSDGENRIFDGKMLEGEVFEPLKDEEYFKNFYIESGAVTWNERLDCSPYSMYYNGEKTE